MNEYYNEKLQQGLEYQDFISDQLGLSFYSSKKYQNEIGENKFGLEIKFDNVLEKTNNLYIETEEKSNSDNNNFVPSGIYREDNSCLYLIGNYKSAYLFSKRSLKKYLDKYKFKQTEIPTSKGVLIPVYLAEELSINNYKFEDK